MIVLNQSNLVISYTLYNALYMPNHKSRTSYIKMIYQLDSKMSIK